MYLRPFFPFRADPSSSMKMIAKHTICWLTWGTSTLYNFDMITDLVVSLSYIYVCLDIYHVSLLDFNLTLDALIPQTQDFTGLYNIFFQTSAYYILC